MKHPSESEKYFGGIVHQEQRDAVVMLQIPGADVLLVAAQIRKTERLVIENAKKALRPSSILDVRPARLAGRSHVGAVPFL